MSKNIERTCPICKKNFIPAPYHVYKEAKKVSARLVCSYHCMLKAEKAREKNES